MENRLVKWFDLSRFGAALRVVPESPLRGVSITCFEIFDNDLYQNHYYAQNLLASETNSFTEPSNVARDLWTQARTELGFSGQPQTIFADGGESKTHRFYSLKTEFTLGELKRLVPGVDASDYREMPIEQIVLVVRPDAELSNEWAAFANDVLANEAIGVWTPKVNPFAVPFAQSPAISMANPEPQQQRFALLGTNRVAVYYGMADKLDRAKYRQNALTPFYADLESATKDGWDQVDLHQVDLPFAIPIWVTKGGQIIAVRDVRYAPEIMEISPERYFRTVGNGIIVNAIRDSKQTGIDISAEVDKWKTWGGSPDKLIESNSLWRSISTVVIAVEGMRRRHPRLPSDVKNLLDGEVASGFVDAGTISVKPLADLVASDMRLLALTAGRYVDMSDDGVTELVTDLCVALKRGHELLAVHATEISKKKLREVTDAFLAGDSPESTDTDFKHIDTGEKIGGARKDYSRRAMSVDDLDSMNDMERVAHVMKKNVWAAFDYEKMREDGVTPQAAVALKYLKDKLNTAPDRSGRNSLSSEKCEADYIESIALVRDAVSGVKTLDDLGHAMRKLYEIGSGSESSGGRYAITGGSIQQIQWGRAASMLIYEGHEGYMPFKIRQEVRRKVDSWGDEATVEQQWRSVIKPKREKSEAKVEAEKTKAVVDRELHRPHLDRVQREGSDWRGGREITADDLIDHFGFRAVEFGNWLPQDERQQVLNMSFDSLCDLADALDIPPKGLSFDGDLAVAFGSRGRGGKQAALAHFEPARTVINLTRMNGAGSLAHEWMHALDFHLGNKTGYASEAERSQGAMAALSQTMKHRAATEDELYKKASESAERGKEYAGSWLYGQGPETMRELKTTLETLFHKAHAQFYESSVKHIELVKDNKSFAEFGISSSGAVPSHDVFEMGSEIVSELRGGCSNKQSFTKFRDKIEANIVFMVNNLALVSTIDAVRAMKVVMPLTLLGGPNSRETDFLVEAKALDKTRSEPYWATTRELFARSGAAYVSDKIEAKNARSDYLVYGADEERYATHSVGNPNPTGRDRLVLADRFNDLLAEYRLECVSGVEVDAAMEP